MNTVIYPFALAGMVMVMSLLLTIVWAAAVHDGKLKMRDVGIARVQFRGELLLSKERIAVRDRTLSWASGEFHDHVAQVLAVMRSRMLRNLHEKSRQVLIEEIVFHAGLIMNCVADVRELSHSLSGSLVERVGLKTALGDHLSYIGTIYQLKWLLLFPEAEPDVPPEVGQMLYRIVQECLHNTIRHARASQVSVSVSYLAGGPLTLEVADDGVGVSEGKVITGSGMGLMSIRERVRQLGGSLVITTGDHQGFKSFITFNHFK